MLFPMESTKPLNNFDYIDIEAIDNKLNIIANPKSHTVETAPSRATRKIYPTSTLFSMVRPYLRNIAFVGEKYKDCIASTGFYVCTPMSFIDPEYLFILLKSDFIVNSLNFYMKGDNSPSINGGHIEEFLFPIPSLNYQRKVVNRLKQILPQIDNILLEALDLTNIINKLKQKILDYYYGENSCYKSYYENKFTTIGEILQFERGSSPRPIKSFIAEDGINWIKISDGKLNDMYIESTQEKITIEGAKKSRSVSYGELILSNSMSYGKPYILKINGCIHDGWYVFRKNENIDVKFLYYFLISGYAQNQIKNYASGSTVSNISSDLMKKIVITIYDTQTQKLMVEQIEKNLSIINKIKEQLI